ncbi:hypothetical protein ACH5RR_039820 [Cinchona calisaya]|uniref:Disease resistance N-terminal domain-containing protein n=1 Tax=Cinchona calisaya TaxID=153742 RepID=A0ABD2XZD9_9GENT
MSTTFPGNNSIQVCQTSTAALSRQIKTSLFLVFSSYNHKKHPNPKTLYPIKEEKKKVDCLVSSTIQVLLEKAISHATDRISLVLGFKKDMESLRGSAAMIASVLADADDKQRHSQAVLLWLKRLEQVAFDANNVLDELNYEILHREVEYRNQIFKGNKVCFFFSFSNVNIAFR